MAEVLNLNRARKAKRRAEAERRAAANRIAFGRTKSETAAAKAEAARSQAQLDAVKRDS
jgi:hypothetical protein